MIIKNILLVISISTCLLAQEAIITNAPDATPNNMRWCGLPLELVLKIIDFVGSETDAIEDNTIKKLPAKPYHYNLLLYHVPYITSKMAHKASQSFDPVKHKFHEEKLFYSAQLPVRMCIYNALQTRPLQDQLVQITSTLLGKKRTLPLLQKKYIFDATIRNELAKINKLIERGCYEMDNDKIMIIKYRIELKRAKKWLEKMDIKDICELLLMMILPNANVGQNYV